MKFVLPKGRLFKPSIELLRKAGVELSLPEGRSLVSADGKVSIARAFDVPVYVEHGIDVGIAGSDVVEERGSDVFVPLELPFGKCRLSVAVPAEKPVEPEDMEGYRVATKFPNVTRGYFSRLGVEVETIKLHGSVELAVKTGIADAIVDIVETGSTLRANGLVETARVMNVSALLLVNRIAQKVRFEEINGLVMAIRRVIDGA